MSRAVIFKLGDQKLKNYLSSGKVAVIPTDTLYGLCAAASNIEAVRALYKLKHRHAKPGTIIAASIDQLAGLGIKRRYLNAVSDYWPGPISIEIPHGLSYLSQGTGRQALRVIANDSLKKLLEATGPLLTSSCNQLGKPPANNIEEAINYFGDRVGAYADGGDLSDRQPSTLIRIVDDAVEIIREGAVKLDGSGRIVQQSL